MASPQLTGVVDHPVHRVKLVITREDKRLCFVRHPELVYFLFGFHIHKAMKNSQPGVALTYLFPKISNGVFTVITGFITGVTIITFVKRQEKALIALQLCTHGYFAITHSKMDHGSALKAE